METDLREKEVGFDSGEEEEPTVKFEAESDAADRMMTHCSNAITHETAHTHREPPSPSPAVLNTDNSQAKQEDPDAEDEDESPALQRIVEFYEAHPYFYNLRHEKYRNAELKKTELAELAKEIKWTVKKIKRRFKNLRSAYGKLKNRAESAGKSGQGICRLTSLQEWKLRNLTFLDEVIQPRNQGQEVAKVAGEDKDNTDGESRDDFAAQTLTCGAPTVITCTLAHHDQDRRSEGRRKRGSSADSRDSRDSRDSASKRNRHTASTSPGRIQKGAKRTPDMGAVLTAMLLENQRRGRETEKRLEEFAARQPDEREAWGNWLQTVVRNCPKEKFRQFQVETLALSQRYQPMEDEGQRRSGHQYPDAPQATPSMLPPQPTDEAQRSSGQQC